MLGPFLRTDFSSLNIIQHCNKIYSEWLSVNYPMHRTYVQ